MTKYFYILETNGVAQKIECEGEPFEYEGIKMFTREATDIDETGFIGGNSLFTATEVTTGRKVSRYCETVQEAQQSAIDNINRHGIENVIDTIAGLNNLQEIVAPEAPTDPDE